MQYQVCNSVGVAWAETIHTHIYIGNHETPSHGVKVPQWLVNSHRVYHAAKSTRCAPKTLEVTRL